MKEQYDHTPEKNVVPGPTFQTAYRSVLQWISRMGPLDLVLGFPIGRHAGDRYRKSQFQIGPSF
jgi:outer membrane protein insertion porin family